ncbi:MAG: hypothetical protein ACO2O4_03180 [Minisyncoccia bacterium]|jgi:hypothetical protein
MWLLKKKAQLLIIATFSIVLGGIIVFVTLFPILSNIKGLRQTTDSYQALANSEAGLEIELYNQKVDLLGNIFNNLNYIDLGSCSSEEIGNSDSETGGRNRQKGQGPSTGKARNCQYSHRIKFDLDIATTSISNVVYLKITSVGKYGDFERTLFTGFSIGTINTP